MPTEIVVSLKNEPGALARLGNTLGDAGVNIETLAGFGVDGEFLVRLIASDTHKALQALRASRFIVTEATEILETTLEDRPGALGALCSRLGSAGINIDAFYIRGESPAGIQVAIAMDDLDRGKALL